MMTEEATTYRPTLSSEAKDFIAGSISGCISIIAGQPLDTLKVRLQTSSTFAGPIQCLKHIIKNEGFLSLYSGMIPPIATSTIQNAMVFSCYGYTLKLLHDDDNEKTSMMNMCIAGGAAGLYQSFILSPSDMIKIRLQAEPQKYSGVMDCIRKLIKEDGARGVFRGLSGTIYREVPAFASYFCTYYSLTDMMDGSWAAKFFAGGCAGAVSWTIAYPVDIAKTIIQTSSTEQRSVGTILRQMVAEKGVKHVYRGLGTAIARSLPVNAVVFPVYDLSIIALDTITGDEE